MPWFAWPAGAADRVALYGGLVLAPADYQQGDGFRIIYVHAPSAWLSLMIYSAMASSAAVGLIWRMKVAHAVAAQPAPASAPGFTAVSLVTGMLWGKPMWGTYWAWDPRLTSQLILLFLYLGYMGLRGAHRGHRARRHGQRGAGDRRRRQRADRPLFGGLVELAAPGAQRDASSASRRCPPRCWCRC